MDCLRRDVRRFAARDPIEIFHDRCIPPPSLDRYVPANDRLREAAGRRATPE
jgi:hypothetical protein